MLMAIRFSPRRAPDDDDDDANADKAADGIGVVDVAHAKLKAKLNAGSDPEEFDLSKDGRRIYISNEDIKTASVINIACGQRSSTSSLWARSPRA